MRLYGAASVTCAPFPHVECVASSSRVLVENSFAPNSKTAAPYLKPMLSYYKLQGIGHNASNRILAWISYCKFWEGCFAEFACPGFAARMRTIPVYAIQHGPFCRAESVCISSHLDGAGGGGSRI
jgi:hypothetical protein